MGAFAVGEWEIDSVEKNIQLYRYRPGGVFSKHRDGPTHHSPDLRSFFTVLVYLNDGYEGGHTTVYTDNLSDNYQVPHGAGNCFVMLQRTLHEGAQVTAGIKYALRCDVLYRRTTQSVTAENTVRHLDRGEQAKRWFQLASGMELSGCVNESVPYYQRANRLDPDLMA